MSVRGRLLHDLAEIGHVCRLQQRHRCAIGRELEVSHEHHPSPDTGLPSEKLMNLEMKRTDISDTILLAFSALNGKQQTASQW